MYLKDYPTAQLTKMSHKDQLHQPPYRQLPWCLLPGRRHNQDSQTNRGSWTRCESVLNVLSKSDKRDWHDKLHMMLRKPPKRPLHERPFHPLREQTNHLFLPTKPPREHIEEILESIVPVPRSQTKSSSHDIGRPRITVLQSLEARGRQQNESLGKS